MPILIDLSRPHPTPTGAPSPNGPIQRWLLDPAATPGDILGRARSELAGLWSASRPIIILTAVALTAVVLLVWRLRVWAWRRARAEARWVNVIAAPRSDTADGQALWRQLTGLLRPGALGGRMRLLTWELHAAHDRVHAGLWVPATINPTHVANAVAGAYPRARASLGSTGAESGPPLPRPWPAPASFAQQAREFLAARRGRPAPVRRPAAVGYLLVPRMSMWLPLLTGDAPGSGRKRPRANRTRSSAQGGTDELGMLCLGLADVPQGYRAIVQILARPLPPATRRAAARVIRSGGTLPGPGLVPRTGLAVLGLIASVLRQVLDLVTPGPGPRSASGARSGSGRRDVDGLDPVARQQHREAAAKAASELVEICVRVTVSGPNRVRCRERAWELANGLRAVITAQGTNTIRLPHPEQAVSTRARSNWRAAGLRLSSRAGHRRGWFVATDTEVGVLARLPHHPALYRFDVAGAPHLPAPTDIPRMRQSLNGFGHTVDPTDSDSRPGPTIPVNDETDFQADAFDGNQEANEFDGATEASSDEEWPEGGWYGWDEDFPELNFYDDGEPGDGDDPDGGYRGEAA